MYAGGKCVRKLQSASKPTNIQKIGMEQRSGMILCWIAIYRCYHGCQWCVHVFIVCWLDSI